MSITHSTPHLDVGKQCEELACRYLRDRNYALIARNWRRPWGEIDIIARKNGVLHFVEVKGESSAHAGFDAFRRAGHDKLKKVVRTAKTWIAQHKRRTNEPWQLDVIQVSVRKEQNEAHIIHFKKVPL